MPDWFAHETAVVDEGAEIGSGTKVWHYSHVCKGARLGPNCVVGQNCYVAPRAVMGEGVKLQNNISVYDLVTLEDGVFVGPSAVFTNDLNPRARFPKGGRWVPTLVREGATIGANATILCGITLGAHCFIAAGAVVTHDIPDYAMVMGVPARVKGYICECGTGLVFFSEGAACPCGRSYRLTDAGNAVKTGGE